MKANYNRIARPQSRMRLVMRQRTRTRTLSRQRIIITSSVFVSLALGLLLFINLSDNRQVLAAANGDYRSVANGNWNSVSTWEKYNGSSWVAATVTPTSADGAISISNGTIITVTANITVDQVSVQPNGQLKLNSGITITLANGTGTDLDVNGIFTNSGTITINSGATIIFEPNGKYQHNYTTSAGKIPTATWSNNSTCEIIGYTSNSTAPTGLQSFYNFSWNCPSQTSNVNLGGGLTTVNGDFTVISSGSGELRLSGASSTLNITGNFIQTGGTLVVVNSNNATGTINVSGNWTHSGGTLTVNGNPNTNAQIVFNKSGTQTFTASGNTVSGNIDFTVNINSILDIGNSILLCRNFTVASGSTLCVSSPNGIITSGSANINASVAVNFNSNSNFIFNGSSAQVTGSGFPSTVNNLTINNSSGINLSSNITINGTLNLSSGKINTGSYELITTNSSETSITGYSPINYIIGNLRRSVNASGSYDFPVGTASNYELINVTLSSMTGFTDILGTFSNSNPIVISLPLTNLNVNGTSITEMLDYGYWTLSPNSLMTGGTYSVTLNEKGQTNSASDPLSYCVLKRANALALWQSLGSHSNETQSEAGGVAIASRSGLTSFSQFGIGKGAGALPIELTYFDAKPSGNAVKCSWQTATEVNNNFFTVERSTNGRDFISITTVPGAGNSTSTKNYSITDNNVSNGQLYYRLKQTDFDGKFTYSKTKSVIFSKENSDEIISISSVSPNPFQDNFSVTYSVQKDADITIALMNSVGQLVYSEKQNSIKGLNRFDYNEGSNLPNGVYFVRISFNDKVQIKKIIKN